MLTNGFENTNAFNEGGMPVPLDGSTTAETAYSL
jgi:hypothetical protein